MDPRHISVEHGLDVLRLRCKECKQVVDEWGPLDGPEVSVWALARESLAHACREPEDGVQEDNGVSPLLGEQLRSDQE